MIRPALVRWYEIVQQLLTATKQTEEEQRDAIIEKIDGLLDERDQLQQQIQAPFTPEEEVLGKQLVLLEKQVVQSLDAYMKLIRTNINDSKTKKEHVKTYMNPYGKVARDGTFYDTKQ